MSWYVIVGLCLLCFVLGVVFCMWMDKHAGDSYVPPSSSMTHTVRLGDPANQFTTGIALHKCKKGDAVKIARGSQAGREILNELQRGYTRAAQAEATHSAELIRNLDNTVRTQAGIIDEYRRSRNAAEGRL